MSKQIQQSIANIDGDLQRWIRKYDIPIEAIDDIRSQLQEVSTGVSALSKAESKAYRKGQIKELSTAIDQVQIDGSIPAFITSSKARLKSLRKFLKSN